MNLDTFTEIMQEVGFDMVKYYAHVYYHDEPGLELDVPIVEDIDASMVYSGCWYGGAFFEWLFPHPTIPVDKLYANRIIHGDIASDKECHSFLVITTDIHAIIFNTYGGITDMIINSLPLDEANGLLVDLMNNDVSAVEELFGVSPDYDQMDMGEIELRESPFYLPTQRELAQKIDILKGEVNNMEDKIKLESLKTIILSHE